MIMVFHMEDFVMAYTIADPNESVLGKTISQWTQDWETWYVQSRTHQNAIDDRTGQFANLNNDGPIFFLGGTAGGDATRTFTVPAGKPLLLPMLNVFDTLDTESNERSFIEHWPSTVTDVRASIDGTPIADPTRYLETTSDFFSMGSVRPGTVATELFHIAPHAPVPAQAAAAQHYLQIGQELNPTLATGYYLMIEGLSPGQHTLEFGGSTFDSSTNTSFSTHVVDHIKVV
jgi:hypothetical protein